MVLRLSMFVFMLCASVQCLQAGVISNAFYNPATGNDYFVVDNTTWIDAQNQAVALGGNLVTINNAAENQWLATTFANIPGLTWPNNSRAGEVFWTGFNDIQVEGDWVWVSGEAVTYTNWTATEPSNLPFPGGEDGGHIYVDSGSLNGSTWIAGQWNSGPGALSIPPNSGIDPVYGIIEVPSVAPTVPEPTSALSPSY